MPKAVARIQKRIDESLSSSDRDSLVYYLETTRDAQKEYADALRRSATVMLLLMAAFVLLIKGGIKQVDVGPLLLSHVTTVTAFIPAAVAYFYYDALNCATWFEIVTSAYSGTFAIWNKIAEEKDLDIFVQPRTPTYLQAGYSAQESSLPEIKTMFKIGTLILVLALIGPIAFLGYAFYQLSAILRPDSVLLWCNVSIAMVFLSAASWEFFS